VAVTSTIAPVARDGIGEIASHAAEPSPRRRPGET
jgi:hypothetical protein